MDFWTQHGWVFLCFLLVFPRLTLLFSSVASGGFLWWLGWLITPRLLIAILALPYLDTNPVLVVGAWILAIAGFLGEKTVVKKVVKRRRRR
jgi:hypothetical protein